MTQLQSAAEMVNHSIKLSVGFRVVKIEKKLYFSAYHVPKHSESALKFSKSGLVL